MRRIRETSRCSRTVARSGALAAIVLAQLSCAPQGQHAETPQSAAASTGPAARIPSAASPATAADTAAVVAAVLDYVDAIYQTQPERIRRSVDPGLTKLGHARSDVSEDYALLSMNHEQLLEVARTWNDDGELDPDSARREVTLHAVFDRTASAMLVAEWGVDLLQLHRVAGRWRIIHVLWQTHSEATPPGDEPH